MQLVVKKPPDVNFVDVKIGHVIAKGKSNWPADWDHEARYGESTDEIFARRAPHSPSPFGFRSPSSRIPSETPPSDIPPSPETPRSSVCHDSSTPPPDRTASQYFQQLAELAKELKLSDKVVTAADQIMVLAEAKGIPDQRTSKPYLPLLLRAALFWGCRNVGIVKAFKEIEDDLDSAKKALFRKQFKSLETIVKQDAFSSAPTISPSRRPSKSLLSPPVPIAFSILDYMQSISKQLNLNDRIQDRALEILKIQRIADLITGKHPGPWAAAILLLATENEGHIIGAEHFARASGYSVNSVLNAHRALSRTVAQMSCKGPLPWCLQSIWH